MNEATIEARFARIESALSEATQTIDAIEHELGGAPKVELRREERRTIRGRLHELENDKAAASIAHAALQAAEAARGRSWSTAQKATVFVIGIVTAVLTILRFAGYGG